MTSGVPVRPVLAINEIMFPHNPTPEVEFWTVLIRNDCVLFTEGFVDGFVETTLVYIPANGVNGLL